MLGLHRPAPVMTHQPVWSVDGTHRFRRARKSFELSAQFVRQPLVVTVLETDERTASRVQAGVSSGASATVVLVPKVAYSRVVNLLHELIGSVGRRIVDHEQFEPCIGLLQDTLDRFADDLPPVVCR